MRAPRLYDLASAGLAAGLAGFELIRMIVNRGGAQGHTVVSALIGGLTFCVVLGAAAVGLALHRRFGWIFGAFGVIVAMSHGIIVRSGGDPIGVVHILGGAALMVMIIKSLHWYRTEEETA